MNSVTFNTDEQVQMLLDRFDEVSNKDNTAIVPLSTSIQFKCKCGCEKVQHFAGPFQKSTKGTLLSFAQSTNLTLKQYQK